MIKDGTGTIQVIDTEDLTLNMWVNVESLTAIRMLFGGATFGFSWNIGTDGKQTFGKNGVNQVLSTDTVTTGTYTMVSIVYDQTANTVTFYKNGTVDSGGSDAYSTNFDTGKVYKLGLNPGGSLHYDGLMDEVGIWTRALSGAEISELYNSGSGLQYPFSVSGWSGKIFGISSPAKVDLVLLANISKINTV